MEATGNMADIYTSVKPVLKMSDIFGLNPFISKKSTCKYNTRRYRLLEMFLLVMLTTGLIASTCYNVHSVIHLASSVPEKIKATLILNDIFLKLTNIFILIMRIYFNKRYIMRIFRKLKNVDKIIDIRSRIEMYTRTRSVLSRQTVILFLVLLLSCSCNYYIVYKKEHMSIFQISVDNLSYIVNIVMVLQYISLVRMLLQRYKYINNRIIEYSETEGTVVQTSLKSYNNCTSVNIFCNEKHNLSTLTPRQYVKSEVCGIPMLRLAYIDLYDVVALVNSNFGLPVLMLIISMVIVCVTSFYYGLYSFGSLSAGVDRFSTHLKTFMLVFWVSSYAILFAWLIISCDNTMQEANRGMVNIQRTTACQNMKYGTLLQLQSLSDQLRDMRVEFTACGFFVLNLSLLSSIVCGILTYVLIMIQLA
jgi:hypothetical protein